MINDNDDDKNSSTERLYRSLRVILDGEDFGTVMLSLCFIMSEMLHKMIENKRDEITEDELINKFIETIGERLIEGLNFIKSGGK